MSNIDHSSVYAPFFNVGTPSLYINGGIGITPRDVLIYMDSALGSDSNPGTSAFPVLTLGAAWALLPKFYSGKCRIIDQTSGGGTYTLPIRPGALRTLLMPIPIRTKPTSEFFGIVGQRADVGLGSRTVGAVASVVFGNGNTVSKITDAAGAVYTTHALEGRSVRITSGVNTGRCFTILANDTSSVTLPEAVAGLIAAVDTYVIEKPATTIQLPITVVQTINGFDGLDEGCIAFYGIRFADQVGGPTDWFFQRLRMAAVFCEFDWAAAFPGFGRLRIHDSQIRFGVVLGGGGTISIANQFETTVLPGVAPLDTNGTDGCYFHDGASGFAGILIQGYKSNVTFNGFVCKESSIAVDQDSFVATSLGTMKVTAVNTFPRIFLGNNTNNFAAYALGASMRFEPFGGPAVSIMGVKAKYNLFSGEVLTTYGAGTNGFEVSVGGALELTKTVGVGLSGAGVSLITGGTLIVNDPATLTTITGTVGDCQIDGLNAIPWANTGTFVTSQGSNQMSTFPISGSQTGALPVATTAYFSQSNLQSSYFPLYVAQQAESVTKIQITSVTGNGAAHSDVYTVVKNGVDTTMTVTLTNTTTGSSTTNPVALVAGDTIGIKVVSDAATAAADIIAQLGVRRL